MAGEFPLEALLAGVRVGTGSVEGLEAVPVKLSGAERNNTIGLREETLGD